MKKLLVILFVLVLIFSCKTMQNVEDNNIEFPTELQGKYVGTTGFLKTAFLEIQKDCIIWKKSDDTNFESKITYLSVASETNNIVFYTLQTGECIVFEFKNSNLNKIYINLYFGKILVDSLMKIEE